MRIRSVLLAVCIAGLFALTAQAQWFPKIIRPVREVDRWLGVGWSDGYHRRNPGSNSEYYNPYTSLNTQFYPAHAQAFPTFLHEFPVAVTHSDSQLRNSASYNPSDLTVFPQPTGQYSHGPIHSGLAEPDGDPATRLDEPTPAPNAAIQIDVNRAANSIFISSPLKGQMPAESNRSYVSPFAPRNN